MRDKYTKRYIKLEHNSMKIIAYMMRYNEQVAPPKLTLERGDEWL
jgi:ribosomal protein L33